MSRALDPQVVHEAARWFVRLQGAPANAREQEACARWRASHADHEAAWQKALQITQRLGQLPAAPGMAALGRRQRIDRRDLLKTLALAGVAVPLGWTTYQGANRQGWLADQRTAIGERRRLSLADGSLLQLNSDSAMDILYDADCRRLHLLRGEALLHMRDETRPFAVRSADGCVRGQAALLDIRQGADGTHVAVLEGQVEVRPRHAERAIQVQAGQQIRFDAALLGPLQPLQGRPTAWTRGVLHANEMRLDAFAAELQRYRPGFVRCAPEVAALRLSGAFQLDNTTPVLNSLAQVLPVRVAYRTRYWVAILPA